MKMHNATLDMLAGLFVLAGIASLAVLAIQVSGGSEFRRQGDSYSLHAWFENVGQLKSGAPVRMAGVTIGYVDSISVDKERYEAKVYLRVGRDFQLPADSSAAIYTSGLLGEQYIGLEPGGDEVILTDGDAILLTSSAIVLEDLIGKFLLSNAGKS